MSKPGYPSWWNTTLTIYNQYVDPITDIIIWYRTVVTDCFWKYAGERVLINGVELNTSSVICRIPEDSRYQSKYIWDTDPGHEYLYPDTNLNPESAVYPLPHDNSHFTLGREDIIVLGEVKDEIDEYGRGLGIKSTDLLAKYSKLQGCMKVETVVENVGGGRNNPHYYVAGSRG